MNAPGGPIKEVGTALIFLVAAGNVFVYTVKTFKKVYTRPPLSTWQKGNGEKPSQGSETEASPTESPVETGGGLLAEALKALPIPGIQGGFLGGVLP